MKWLISRVNRECHQCHSLFLEGNTVFSTVVPKENAEDNVIETERYDLCAGCWNAWTGKDHPFWKCLYTEKQEDESPVLPDKDTIMALFLQKMAIQPEGLSVQELREAVVFRYLLALMLERKKRIVAFNGNTLKDGRDKTLFYKDAQTPDIFQVEIPDLSSEEISYFQGKLKDMLPLGSKRKKEADGP